MSRRQPPQLELQRIIAPPDQYLSRQAGGWVRDKLTIINAYSTRFTQACKKADGGVYADAFCGPGLNHVRDTDDYLYGSGMLAVRTIPQFDSVYLMDLDIDSIQAMKARVGNDPRVRVNQGDANSDFLTMLSPVLTSRAPVFCVLDPQGIELRWLTVKALGQERANAQRPELLILLSDRMGFMRLLPADGQPTRKTLDSMHDFFGNHEWQMIHAEKQAGSITPSQARARYAELYRQQLLRLGYSNVLRREVCEFGDIGRSLYQLLFATQHQAGERIMAYIFDTMKPQNPQLSLAM